MAKVTFRGVTTHKLYRFGTSNIPAALQGANSTAPADSGTFNGETCVLVGDDGSILRGTIGPNTTDPYSPGRTPSTWEKQ